MTDIAAILGHSIRAGSLATLLLLASAGAASAAHGGELVPDMDAALEPITGGTVEQGTAQVEPAVDNGTQKVVEATESARAAIDPVVRSAPPPGDAVATVERITGSAAPDVLPGDLKPPVGRPADAPTAGPDRSPAMPIARARGIADRAIHDMPPDRGAAADRPVAAPATSAAASAAAAARAGQPNRVTLPPAGPVGGDALTASTVLLALTLGLVGGCRPAIVARLVRQFPVRVRIPVSRALLPPVPPG